MTFVRYAVYYVPAAESLLAQLGNRWLGRDPETGQVLSRPVVEDLDPSGIQNNTVEARRYGFHGTLKPPFRLKAGATYDDLVEAAFKLSQTLVPVIGGPLEVAPLGHFIALRPTDSLGGIGEIARACVTKLDGFRAPAPEAELARRRAKGLTGRQEALLQAWGYPYVMDEFRFHLTLTGPLPADDLSQYKKGLEVYFEEVTAMPFALDQIALFGDPGDGAPFKLLQRFPL